MIALTVQVPKSTPEELKTQQLCFALFASPKGFPEASNEAILSQCIDLSQTKMRPLNTEGSEFDLSIQGTQPMRTYALSLFVDANGDKKLNTSFIGIPKEAFGFSNNPRVSFSAPSFDECKWQSPFQVAQSLTVRVERYFNVSRSGDSTLN